MPRQHLTLIVFALCLNLGEASAAESTGASCVQALSVSAPALEAAAQQAFRDRQYAGAYGRFARLADAGNAQAAEMALFMLLNGPGLFASDWTATEKQQSCWNALLVGRARLRVAMQSGAAGD